LMFRPLPTLPPPPITVAVPSGAVATTVLPVMWVSLIVSIPPVPIPAESAHAQAVEPAGTDAVTWLLVTRLSERVSTPSSPMPPVSGACVADAVAGRDRVAGDRAVADRRHPAALGWVCAVVVAVDVNAARARARPDAVRQHGRQLGAVVAYQAAVDRQQRA